MNGISGWRGKNYNLTLFVLILLLMQGGQSSCQNIAIAQAATVANVANIIPVNVETITYGSIIRLRHRTTGGHILAAGDQVYWHNGTSGQVAAYAAVSGPGDNFDYWVVKGPHHGDRFNCPLGWPVKQGDIVRLEHLNTGRNLHSHNNHPSPVSGQKEVTMFGSGGTGDTNDNWRIIDVWAGSRGVLRTGSIFRLQHANTGNCLHSHPSLWMPGKQEVTCYWSRNDDDWWEAQLITGPHRHDLAKGRFEEQRGGTLNYNTVVQMRLVETGWDRGDNIATRNLWAHGGSRHDVNNTAAEPHNHLEILIGPRDDARSQMAPSFFVLQSVENPYKTGPIKFGERVRILSVFGGAGYPNKSGLLQPFKRWWLNAQSRWGSGAAVSQYYEIVISRDDHQGIRDGFDEFVFEPTIPALIGEIRQNDVIEIKNVKTNYRLWWNWDNRWGNRYFELLANNKNDPWGPRDGSIGGHRDQMLQRFNVRQVMRGWLNGEAQGQLDMVDNVLKTWLGAEAARQEAALEKAKQAQLATEKAEAERLAKAAQEEAKRVAAEGAIKLEEIKKMAAADAQRLQEELKKKDAEAVQRLAEAKKLAEADAQRLQAALQKKEADAAQRLAEAEKKGGEALAKAQAESERIKAESAQKLAEAEKSRNEALAQAKAEAEKIKAESTKTLADAAVTAEKRSEELVKAAKDQLGKEKALAIEELKKAQEKADNDAKMREEASKQVYDKEKAEQQRKIDEATALAEEMKAYANLPVGFVKIPGKAKKVAVGLREGFVARKKAEILERWAIGVDDRLYIGTDAIDPWTPIVAKDDQGKEITGFADVAIGGDAVCYVRTLDGKVYRYNRPDAEPTPAPSEVKKEEKQDAAASKAEQRATKKAKTLGRARPVLGGRRPGQRTVIKVPTLTTRNANVKRATAPARTVKQPAAAAPMGEAKAPVAKPKAPAVAKDVKTQLVKKAGQPSPRARITKPANPRTVKQTNVKPVVAPKPVSAEVASEPVAPVVPAGEVVKSVVPAMAG